MGTENSVRIKGLPRLSPRPRCPRHFGSGRRVGVLEGLDGAPDFESGTCDTGAAAGQVTRFLGPPVTRSAGVARKVTRFGPLP